MTHDYRQRCVALIDILGFSKLVERSEDDPKIFEKVRDALLGTERWVHWYDQERHELLQGSVIASAFSDHVALTGKLSDVVEATAIFAFELLQRGVMVRGGIVEGLIYHEKGVIFGPALIAAHELESKHAISPRIVSNGDLVSKILGHKNFSDFCPFLKDSDGYWYLDVLSPEWVGLDEGTTGAYLSLLETVRGAIQETLSEHSDNPRIKPKAVWYAEYFNRTLNVHSQKLDYLALEPLRIS